MSVPDGSGKTAIHFDQSTTAVALGKITMAKAAGEKIPVGWALDKNGKPTTDAAAALQGSLVSSGGYKGWGFGLMAEVLAAGIAGGLASQFVQPLKATNGEPHNLGQYYILIDPQKSNSFENLLNDLKAAVSQDEGTRLPGRDKVEEEFVAVPNDLLVLLEQLSGTDWKD
jgi:(2R)-3-sulfolactate dehydrogenase (NADP+)